MLSIHYAIKKLNFKSSIILGEEKCEKYSKLFRFSNLIDIIFLTHFKLKFTIQIHLKREK